MNLIQQQCVGLETRLDEFGKDRNAIEVDVGNRAIGYTTVILCKCAEVSIQKLRLKYKMRESYGYKEKGNMTLSESERVSMSLYESSQKMSQKESERSH
jgi:hypothetical protein